MMKEEVLYVTAWDSQKNLSGYYNRTIINLPSEESWVCIKDRDAYFCHPQYGHHINQVIKDYGDEYRLMTCRTNRVGQPFQCVENMWDVENGKVHEDTAKMLWDKHGTEVVNICDKPPFSGMLILVQKRFLTENRLLKDGLLLGSDNEMFYIAHEGMENVGMMMGVYVYHYYRNGQQHDKSHLL